MFEQALIDEKQVELPDYWLTSGNPWEVERLDVTYKVRFYGRSVQYTSRRKVPLNNNNNNNNYISDKEGKTFSTSTMPLAGSGPERISPSQRMKTTSGKS